MTEQRESRWSLNSTGNRVLFAVLVGLAIGVVAGVVGVHGAARVAVFALAAVVTYGLATVLRR